MAGKIPESFIQDLLARTDLVDLIDARIPLKRSGSNYVCRCPFHNEKTPSFSVNRQKQFYYCFGCGAHGSAIGFLMDYDRLTFPEAVEALADNLGLTVPREEGAGSPGASATDSLQPLYDLQEQACRFYQQQLKSHPAAQHAVEYLRHRGISGEIAQRFRLGYAPPGSRNLPSTWPTELLQRCGLVASRDRGGSHDWFRDRVVFPIRDRRGRIVGFGGRILGEGVPKYLNSPETPIFQKHREVYGLYELLQAVRKPASIIVVEGYMDVIALAQSGIPEVVATLGTATSTDQIGLLFRYTSTLVICFDGDTAGQAASWKALDAALPHLREGRQLRFLDLPDGHDPDSLIREEGESAFRERIQSGRMFSEYFFGRLSQGVDLATIEGRSGLVERARPAIQKLPQGVFRDMIEQRLSELSGLLHAGEETRLDRRPEFGGKRKAEAGQPPSSLRTFMALLVQHPQLVEQIDSSSLQRLVAIKPHGELIRKVVEFLNTHPHATAAGLVEGFRDTETFPVIAKLAAWDTHVAADHCVETFVDHMKHLTVDRLREGRLQALIQRAQNGQLTDAERDELRHLTLSKDAPFHE